MADLGTVGTRDIQQIHASPRWPTARLDPQTSPGAVGVRDDLMGKSGVAQPWNQTGAGSGQPVVGASIQIG